MDRERHRRAWPLVCLLACLVILYLVWPRAWDPAASFRSANRPGGIGEDRPTAATPEAPGRAAEGKAAPGSAPMAGPTATRAEAEPPPAPKFPAMPKGWKWDDLQLVDPALAPHGPTLYKEAAGPSRKQAATRPSPPQPAPPWGIMHLPPVEVCSPDGSLPTIDLVPLWDVIVAQSRRHGTRASWESGWPKPVALLERLEALAGECQTGPWALRALREIKRLGLPEARGSHEEVLAIIDRLEELGREAESQAARLDDPLLATELRRAKHALARRLAVWTQAISSGGPQTSIHDHDRLDPKRLSASLAKVTQIPADPDLLDTWQEFLELEPLQHALAQPAKADRARLHLLARNTLQWLTAPGLTDEQREFLDDEPFVGFKTELRRWAFEPVDLGTVLEHLEESERTGNPSDARRLAEDCLLLALSADPEQQALGQKLQTHYRNANLRVVLTGELLERMMPEREPEHERIKDRVLGTTVRGRAVASADLGVLLLPDPDRLRLALVVKGLVSSLTQSTAGPATFFNDSKSNYVAVREIELGTWGITRHPAQVAVDSDVRLRSLQTTLDGVPLLGGIVHEIAQSQHAKMRPEMSREVKQKVAARARELVERETEARLSEMDQTLKTRILDPLQTLSLGPAVVSSHTTERRLTMRLRLAAENQLAGDTPRPRAPGDSLASCQIHQSALNNAIERLLLDGGTFTPAEVRARIAAVFNTPEMLEENPGRDDVQITFADRDAVRAQFRDGEVALTLSIARLKKSPHLWKDFQVRAYYRPELNDRGAELARHGIVEVHGSQALGSQIALRGVFSGLFSRTRPWKITPDSFLADPRFEDLAVTQLVIDDGWIGLALGPSRHRAEPVVAQRDSAGVE